MHQVPSQLYLLFFIPFIGDGFESKNFQEVIFKNIGEQKSGCDSCNVLSCLGSRIILKLE